MVEPQARSRLPHTQAVACIFLPAWMLRLLAG